MGTDLAAIAARLEEIAEELADVALDRLREAAGSIRDGGEPDPVVTAEEKRITRARRAVEKAAVLLVGPGSPSGGLDEGP